MEMLAGTRTTGARYDQATKDLAYEVFAHRAAGDMVETIRLLSELVSPPIPQFTVYDWSRRYNWRDRLDAEKRELSPVLWETYFGGLVVAAPEAVTYLRSVINSPDASDKDKISASRVLLGQVVAHIGQLEALMPKPQSEDSKLEDLSTEELLALASSAAEGD